MMLKGRTHQFVSYDVSAMSFRDWLEKDVRVKPPKDVSLSDDWLRCVMKAFLLLSPGTSWERAILRRILRRSTDDVHEVTHVTRVECSADLLEVKGAKMSFRSQVPGSLAETHWNCQRLQRLRLPARLRGLVCISDRTVLIISLAEPHGRCDPRSSRRCSRRYHQDCQGYGCSKVPSRRRGVWRGRRFRQRV